MMLLNIFTQQHVGGDNLGGLEVGLQGPQVEYKKPQDSDAALRDGLRTNFQINAICTTENLVSPPGAHRQTAQTAYGGEGAPRRPSQSCYKTQSS